MIGTAAWLALAALVLSWEVVCRLSRGRLPGLARVGALLAVRLPGRVFLLGFWVFLGFHLFVRRSLPGR